MKILAFIYIISIVFWVGYVVLLRRHLKEYCQKLKDLGYTPVNVVPQTRWQKIKSYLPLVFFALCPIVNTFSAILLYWKMDTSVNAAFDLADYAFGVDENN